MAKFNGKSSEIHKSLDRDAMLTDAWWCTYAYCCGQAIGDVGNPFFGAEARNLCLHGRCEMTDVADPFCSGVNVMLCCTSQCQLLPLEGSPTVVCCNKPLAGEKGDKWKPVLFDFKPSFDQQFWLYYLIFGGCSMHAPGANDRPLLASMSKQLCIKQGLKLAPPVEDGVLCTSLGTNLCFWSQLEFPPSDKAKFCACFGKWLSGKDGKQYAGPGPMNYGKPGQEEMA